MKLTKKRFSCWEDKDDNDYQKDLDDELIISVNPEERSRDIADYILKCQEKAKDYDKLERIVFDLTRRLKECENGKRV